MGGLTPKRSASCLGSGEGRIENQHRAASMRESTVKDDVVSVTAMDDFRLQVEFADGKIGTADLRTLVLEHPAYRALKDPAAFKGAFVHPEMRSVCWAGGIDIAPETLRHLATGEPLPSWMEAGSRVR
jgi:hypothetical protein